MAISDHLLRKEQKLFKRLVLSSEDFDHAKSFAKALLELPDDEKEAVRLALQTAMVVSYWRPFSQNKGAPDATPALPEKKFLRILVRNFCAFCEEVAD